jgi:C4-dicarboxylate transporter, DctQ subunit
MTSASPNSPSRLYRIINSFEENAIALLLGLMTVFTFANVVARYVFNSNILWALEATVFLFAWLVLFGVSHCVKISAHLGVDLLVNMAPPPVRKIMGITAVICCLVFSVLLLIGGWEYWWRFASISSFLEVNDIPMPEFMQFLADLTNYGEPYEKIPRYIPYMILPIGMALLTFRFLQAGWNILNGQASMLIASHEAEELVEEAIQARIAKEKGE